MSTLTDMPKYVHHGRNIKRFREMFGIKQEVLAEELGEGWSQKKVSFLEAKEEVEPEILEQVAKVLKVPVEAIKNFDEQHAINIISNTFNDTNSAVVGVGNNCNFNPLDELIKTIDENKKLYERLLQSERELLQAEKEKNELLQKMLETKS